MPVSRNAHHTQFPATPFCRTMSATRLGVSVENVVATIDVPRSHHGIERPERKYADVFCPALRAAARPTSSALAKYAAMMAQSIETRFMSGRPWRVRVPGNGPFYPGGCETSNGEPRGAFAPAGEPGLSTRVGAAPPHPPARTAPL